MDIGSTENLILRAGDGNDVITAGNGLAGLINLTLDGGAGDDTITGGDGNDTITGGDGNDLVVGGKGADTAQLGAGNDTFIWNQGDGSDAVNGGDGTDTLVFNGAAGGENIDISANGHNARLTRALGNITMDMTSIEHIQVAPLGGADTVTVNDLSNTGVSEVDIDLGVNGAGDGQADTVVINATAKADAINVVNNNGVITVSGLSAEVNITNFEATDRLVINGLGGNDVISATNFTGALTGILFTANGGDGNDILVGTTGDDVLSGGAGNDLLIGNGGQDTLDGGTGHNTIFHSAVDPKTVAAAASASGNARGLALLNQFMASSFVATGDDHGTLPTTDPQASQQPLLAPPHA